MHRFGRLEINAANTFLMSGGFKFMAILSEEC